MRTDAEHAEWFRRAKLALKAIVDTDTSDRQFNCCFRGYRCHLGGLFRYGTPFGLTAALLLWWFDHRVGDAPCFDLGHIREVAGELWDERAVDVAWAAQPWLAGA